MPEGAESNFLFEAVAQGVSDLENKRIGHRQMRAAVSDWLLHNRDQVLSGTTLGWDGAVHNFEKYVEKLRQSGQWAGYLELFAAVSVAQSLNILVITSEVIHKLPAKADVGTFLVLKYEAKHYEYVKLGSKGISNLWLGLRALLVLCVMFQATSPSCPMLIRRRAGNQCTW